MHILSPFCCGLVYSVQHCSHPLLSPGTPVVHSSFICWSPQEFLKEHQEKKYIEPSKSPYASPFFFVKKKDGKLWPVQDYRQLNEWTIPNNYPLPLIRDIIPHLAGKKLLVFSVYHSKCTCTSQCMAMPCSLSCASPKVNFWDMWASGLQYYTICTIWLLYDWLTLIPSQWTLPISPPP